ncbi:MAG: DUF1845 domain-containing protein [Gammaproteobacteria bacterium]|nr:DUF1845 domain-containing protein [Gammaproteobacteria bacterium]MCP4090750.1 DUF1845 domain-containing protein [Gammaproteobacteria bacterium]MCP4277177.1 DUF1845 domain-containing protein [Gammaproteobacteria bacterium]MCP4831689.1 DUF1845 domain-containing protein [Gammaproteobacteria bacterium]MCP4928013.1 DUF1845 domain-containing protein [Gammaproteobacteria bacterium]
MATLEQLHARKAELEEKLYAGDLTAESALVHIDNAIAARTRKIEYSQKRLAAIKNAVGKGVSVADAKAVKPKSAAAKRAIAKAKKPLNRF